MEILNVFNTQTLEKIFWKTKTFFKKLEYSFLVESTKVENASFSYKAVTSEANAKANRMVTGPNFEWTCHKEYSFSYNYFFFFLKILFQFTNLL